MMSFCPSLVRDRYPVARSFFVQILSRRYRSGRSRNSIGQQPPEWLLFAQAIYSGAKLGVLQSFLVVVRC
jgi:hypothetical protein